jgi:trans-2,3-dihydro-3-hydroxyanthranilate isomerase
MRYLHLDVFTDRPFEGNQLAVFPEPGNATTELMQTITREMNFSECTFIFPPERDGDVRMRIFTPGSELPMAGHPTIGSTFALAHEGVIAPGRPRFVFELGVGPTPVELEWAGPPEGGHYGEGGAGPPEGGHYGEGGAGPPEGGHYREGGHAGQRLSFAWMTQPLPEFGAAVDDRVALAAAVSLDPPDLLDTPAQVVSCGVPFLFVPLRTRAAVDAVSVDRRALARVLRDAGLDELPSFFFTPDRGESAGDETVYSRMLAPGFGITEDPATGGASGPLGCYLLRHGFVDTAQARAILSLQGVAMQRPSRIHIAIDSEGDAITRVRVGGQSVMVGSGEIFA